MPQCSRLIRGLRRGIALAAFAAALAATLPAPASAEIGFLSKWGGPGSGDGQFTGARSLTIDSAGDVYVVDGSFPDYNRVQKFTPGGAFITKFGSKGSEPEGFYGWGVVAATPSNVYVVDEFNKRIQQYTSTVPPTAYAYQATFGSPGSGDGQLVSPRGAAVDSSGNLYVADSDNDRIQKFTSSGVFIAKWGGAGSGDGQMNQPFDVAVAPDGSVYVADTSNHRIQKFTSSGVFIAKLGGAGSGDGQLVQPEGVATDSAGNVYVADSGNDRIQKFSASGAFIGKFGSTGAGDGQLNRPSDIAVDASGTIYVLDGGNSRVQKYAEGGAPISMSPQVPTSLPGPGKVPKKKLGLWRFIPPGPFCETENGQECYVEIVIPEPGEVTATVPAGTRARASTIAMRVRKSQPKPGIKPVKRQVAKAKKIRLRLELNESAKKIVRRKGKIAVRVRLTFSPKVGKALSTTRTFTFKKKPQKQRAG
jgi:DNA-binding beta-propeller fold protein YncE